MIFAKLDVTLARHHRMLQIPRGARRAMALGVYVSALMYTRESELDGWCPLSAIADQCPSDSLRDLIRAGILHEDNRDGVPGVMVVGYSDKNETRAAIADRRSRERSKKRIQRGAFVASVPECVPKGPVSVSPGESRGTPGSDSDSDSVYDFGEARKLTAREEQASGQVVDVSPRGPMTLALELDAETRAAVAMLGVRDLDGEWLKFKSHHAARPDDQRTAAAWRALFPKWAVDAKRMAAAAPQRGLRGPFAPAPDERPHATMSPRAPPLTAAESEAIMARRRREDEELREKGGGR